jgi:hypothetical protein
MLQILSNYNLFVRMDLEADSWILLSGVTGTWVAPGGDDDVGKPAANAFALPIWSESNRDGSAGFSPDIHSTGNITVIYGKIRGVTDQFTGTPAAGDLLWVTADGKLTDADNSGSGATPVAYCMKPSHSTTYLSQGFTAIEFITI